MSKEYRCICGQIFDNPQKFNGHRTTCKEHIQNKYGDDSEQYFLQRSIQCSKSGETIRKKNLLESQAKLNQWISEQHTCEKCEKVMTEKYGSGRFCSRSCANSHKHSNESKIKVSQTLKFQRHDYTEEQRKLRIKKYYDNPRRCIICNQILAYEKRYRKTCSSECYKLQLKEAIKIAVEKHGGHLSKTYGNNKYGTYKGFHCDSSWELAFVIYCLEHNIQIERCSDKFEYVYLNERHFYHPDFIINGDTYTEIKNYEDDKVIAKQKQFPKDKKYQILYWDDIKLMYDYVIGKYGRNFYDFLYDENYPNFKSKNN